MSGLPLWQFIFYQGKFRIMKKTISLTENQSGLPLAVRKWGSTIFGLFNLTIGVRYLSENPLTILGIGLGSSLIVCGLIMFIIGLILFNPTSKLAPKFEIDDQEINIKEAIHKRTKSIKWTNIKEITFKSFALEFSLTEDKMELVILKVDGATSLEIKKALREFAEKKSITVTGG